MASIGVSARRIHSLGLAVLLGVTAGVTNPAIGAPPATGGDTSIAWQPCGEDRPGYDCATVTVPLDHDRPSRGTMHLALARFPATDDENRLGSVFVNPGGPGGSGVDLVLGGFGEFLGDRLDRRFDVVGFDPRGVGASDPLHCFESEEELVDFWSGQPVFPHRTGQYRPFFDAMAGLATECLDDGQRVAWHMNTADVARDLDLLRDAADDPELTYLGFSYGSYLGNTYANLFPDNVRALVIDGVLDPRLWSSGWQIEANRTATQDVFDQFLRLCDAAGPECAFWTPEGSLQRWDRLATAIRRDPLVLPDGFLYTYDFLIADAAWAMYVPEVWGGDEGAAAFFDLLADAALTGERSRVADAAQVRSSMVERLTASTEEGDYPNGADAFYGNHCADVQYPRAFHEWVAVGEYARLGSPFGPFWWWGFNGCANWPVNDDRYVGPWTAHTSAPVLVVGNHFDGVTDHAGAVAADRLLGNSRLLSYAGWGHTAYGRSQCVTDHTDAYLLTGALPPVGEVCPANPNPFLPEATRADRWTPMVGLPAPWPARSDLLTDR